MWKTAKPEELLHPAITVIYMKIKHTTIRTQDASVYPHIPTTAFQTQTDHNCFRSDILYMLYVADPGGRWHCQACIYFMSLPRPSWEAWDAKKLIKKNQRSADRANNIIIGNTCKVADGWFQADASSVARSRPPIWTAWAVGTLSLILSLSATHTHTHTHRLFIEWKLGSVVCVCESIWISVTTFRLNLDLIVQLFWS